jgi:hypothetical protein
LIEGLDQQTLLQAYLFMLNGQLEAKWRGNSAAAADSKLSVEFVVEPPLSRISFEYPRFIWDIVSVRLPMTHWRRPRQSCCV